MPTSSDLVTDLPADFEVFGQAVDTQMKTNADAAIAKTIVDAKGDLIAATGADAVSRLAVGSNDQVLTADSTTATGLKWAAPATGGGMTLLSTTSLSGTSTTISSISSAYKNLQIVIFGANWAANKTLAYRFNGLSSSIYNFTNITATGSPSSWGYNQLNSFFSLGGNTNNGTYVIDLPNYSYSTGVRIMRASGGSQVSDAPHTSFGFMQTSIGAINSITVAASDFATSFTGGTVLIYGVN